MKPTLLSVGLLLLLTSSLAAGVGPDPYCLEAFQEEAAYCWDYICDPRTTCSYCDTAYFSCVATCPTVCTEPKSVTELDLLQTLYGWNTGTVLCFEAPFSEDLLYARYGYCVKQTHIRRTESYNGTVTDEVLCISYFNTYCYNLTSTPCYATQGFAPNYCSSSS